LIEVDEGARIIGNVIDIPQEDVAANKLEVNQRVEAVFEDVTDEWTLVKWKPIDEG